MGPVLHRYAETATYAGLLVVHNVFVAADVRGRLRDDIAGLTDGVHTAFLTVTDTVDDDPPTDPCPYFKETRMARSGRPPKIDSLKAIQKAVMNNGVSTFSTELAAGNDIDAPGPEGTTPLHIAAHRGNVEFAKALLDAGAEIDPINV